MEIPPSLRELFQGGNEQYAIVDAHQMRHSAWGSSEGIMLIDSAGLRSAAAQGLKGPHGLAPVTRACKLHTSPERLYLSASADSTGQARLLVAILKVGEKNLYHWSEQGEVRNLVNMPCVLDFYVEESFQRQGAGRALFDAMLAAERTTPEQLAYDRPSPKLLRFMGKHFRLTKYAPQQNNFVLFDAFWTSEPHPQPGKQSASQYDTISMRPLTARGAHPPRRALAHGNSKYGRPAAS